MKVQRPTGDIRVSLLKLFKVDIGHTGPLGKLKHMGL